ncbi:MAG: hypothetical protein KC502_19560, partial [Myxococcales bacterium]|nr:hypothetical protein [Myxococcales bacterium]
HPAMEDYRYLDQLDFSPLVRAVTFTTPPSAAQLDMPGGAPPAATDEDEDEALAKLDPTVVEPAQPTPQAQPEPKHVAAQDHPEKPLGKPLGKPHGKAHGKAPDKPAANKKAVVPAALQITDATIGKPLAFLEHPERMDAFWQALVARAEGKQKHVRIRHYGDSHLANDGLSHVLRVMLQRRFGDGGHGFMLASSRTQWYRRKGVRWSSGDSWKPRNFLGGSLRDGAYGYGGVAALGIAGSSFRVRTSKKGAGQKANRFELFWRGVGPAAVQVRIDGKTEVVKLRGDKRDAYRSWDLEDGPHKIRVRVTRGRARIFGAALERTEGITYDSLGIVGARARRWLNANAEHMAAQLTHRPAQLVVFNYGGNSRNDKISEERYIDRFEKVIARLRLSDKEPCLIIGPTDHGKKKRGKVISDPKTVRMIGWQRTLADKAGCAFLDSRALMGGDGAMGRWVKKGLGWADYGHLAPKGQRVLGKAIYGTWMAGLRAYIQRQGD